MDKDYEDGILNAVLSFPDEHAKIFNRVKPEHFIPGGFNRKAYAVLTKLHNEFKPAFVSNEAIITELCELLKSENKDWGFWVKQLTTEAPLPADIDFYINRMIKNYNTRRISEITNVIEKRLQQGESSESITAYTKREFECLETENIDGGPINFHDIAADCIDILESGDNDSLTGIKTLFTDLDALILGMRPGDLIVIAGRPSMGKTTLATNISLNVLSFLVVG